MIATLSNPNVFSARPLLESGDGWPCPATVIWIVAITNAVNLIDGLDGLACGVSTISSMTLLVIALVVSEGNVAILMAALAGGCIGFLPYNLNPAKIFMGDTGSTFLGYILAVVSIQGLFKFYTIISFAVPFLMLGLPIFDTCFAFIRRIAHGQSPMHADRSHVHHRLIDMGFNQKQAVAVLYVISAILGLSAVVLTTSGPVKAMLLLLALCFAGAMCRPDFPGQPTARKTSSRSAETSRTEKGEEEMKQVRVMTIFGTRPEAIKMAPLVQELERRPGLDCRSVLRDGPAPGDAGFRAGNFPAPSPTIDLNIMEPRQTLSTITSKCLLGMEEVLEQARARPGAGPRGHLHHLCRGAGRLLPPDTRWAMWRRGCAPGDKYSPFPEEMNRKHGGRHRRPALLPHTGQPRKPGAGGDHRRECFVTGNTVIDALQDHGS